MLFTVSADRPGPKAGSDASWRQPLLRLLHVTIGQKQVLSDPAADSAA